MQSRASCGVLRAIACAGMAQRTSPAPCVATSLPRACRGGRPKSRPDGHAWSGAVGGPDVFWRVARDAHETRGARKDDLRRCEGQGGKKSPAHRRARPPSCAALRPPTRPPHTPDTYTRWGEFAQVIFLRLCASRCERVHKRFLKCSKKVF